MSNLLWGIAGAALGSVFGMPALGFALGSGAGAAVGGHHHASAPSAPGARLNDLKVQTSTYGIGIPRVYGRYRLAGNVIWARDILEVKDPAGHYLYYGHFAIGLCAGPIAGIRRIWADGKEIFKTPFPEEGIRRHYPPGVRFYPGDEQQLPDSLMEAHQGKSQVPAFRGLAYIVFEQLSLAAFNNRLPSISVEVVQSAVERPLTPEEAAEKTRTDEETVVQDGVRYHIRRGQQRKAAPLGATKRVPAPVSLAEVVTDVCRQVGFSAAQVDTAKLTASVTGFVVVPPTSAREALSGLEGAYGFDTVESGQGFCCVPRGQQAPLPVAEADFAQETPGEPTASIITGASRIELPEQVVLFFNEASQYTLATQTAQRGGTLGQRSERVELPLVLTLEEADQIAQRLLAERWGSHQQVSFSLSRAYVPIAPGDRLLLQGQVLRVLSLAYGSPGWVKIQALCESVSHGSVLS